MVIFDQLRISDDGQRMYINLHINKADYFKNLTLDSLTIMTADKVSETDPNIPTEGYIYQLQFADGETEAHLVLLPSDMNEQYQKSNFSKDLFFVYAKVKGIPDECTPCRLDEEITLGVTFDENLLHQRVMDYTKQFNNKCELPVGFTDFMLTWQAFKSAVETEHYIPAIGYYNQLFGLGAGNSSIGTKNCGCHG